MIVYRYLIFLELVLLVLVQRGMCFSKIVQFDLFNNLAPVSTDVIATVTARSIPNCASLCVRTPPCKSFLFTAVTRDCEMCGTWMENVSGIMSNSVIYAQLTDTPTSLATPTDVPMSAIAVAAPTSLVPTSAPVILMHRAASTSSVPTSAPVNLMHTAASTSTEPTSAPVILMHTTASTSTEPTSAPVTLIQTSASTSTVPTPSPTSMVSTPAPTEESG